MKKLAVIVLAAGQGTRMRSKLAKVLHPVCGRPMALYAADLAEALAGGAPAARGRGGPAGSMRTAHLDRPAGYGRIVRGRDGAVWKIIEDKDASPSERRVGPGAAAAARGRGGR